MQKVQANAQTLNLTSDPDTQDMSLRDDGLLGSSSTESIWVGLVCNSWESQGDPAPGTAFSLLMLHVSCSWLHR